MFQLGWNAQLLVSFSVSVVPQRHSGGWLGGARVGYESAGSADCSWKAGRVELRMGWSQIRQPVGKHPEHSACVPLRLPAASRAEEKKNWWYTSVTPDRAAFPCAESAISVPTHSSISVECLLAKRTIP